MSTDAKQKRKSRKRYAREDIGYLLKGRRSRSPIRKRRSTRRAALKSREKPYRELAGYVPIPHGLVRHPWFRQLPKDAKLIFMYAIDAAYFADTEDREEFKRLEGRAADDKNVERGHGGVEVPGHETAEPLSDAKHKWFLKRHYLLNGTFMTKDMLRQFSGVKGIRAINGALQELQELGLLRVRWADTNRGNKVRFFIVYSSIDDNRCWKPGPEKLWDKLAQRSTPYWAGWSGPEEVLP